MNSQELRALQEAYNQVYELDENRMASRMGKKPTPPAKPTGGKTHSIKDLTPSKPPSPEEKAKARKALGLDEASYSAKAARAGEDIGEPGKNFSKIEKSAAKRYGSKESGKRVAGAVLAKMRANEAVDLYDIILSHLLDEGYAETQEQAEVIMVNMSEDWREDIVEAAADQSDKQIDKGVKTTYKAQNVLDNQHQGRSRGLNRLPADQRADKTKKMRGRLKARRDDLFGERNKREDESRAELKKKYGL
jgi:hypothetical protein